MTHSISYFICQSKYKNTKLTVAIKGSKRLRSKAAASTVQCEVYHILFTFNLLEQQFFNMFITSMFVTIVLVDNFIML